MVWALCLLSVVAFAPDADFVTIQSRLGSVPQTGESQKDTRAVIWQFNAPAENGDVNCLRPLGDVNADGICDVVLTVFDSGYPFDDLLCISGASQGTPSVIWSIRSQQGISGGGGYGPECLAPSPDLNGDGRHDVLYGTAWGGRTFYARSGTTGDSLWYLNTYSYPPSGWVYQVTPFVDLTGDGVPEALAAIGKDANKVVCVNGASSGPASVVWSFTAADGFMSVAVLGDVDGDGVPDVIAGNGTNYQDDRVFCLRGAVATPGPRQIWAVNTGGCVRSVAAMPDLNGDGIPEALAGSSNSMVRCLSGANGVALWVRNVGYSVMKVSPIQDQNGDGVPEVLVGWWRNAILCLDGATGLTLWSTPTGTLNGGDVWTISPIADLDGDGRADVIAGSFDTKVYVAKGTTGQIMGTFSTGRRLYFVGPMPDVNRDGLPEILAGTQGLYGSISSGYCLSGAAFVPLRLSVSLQAGTLLLSWTPHPDAASYWVFGAENLPYFSPGVTPPYQYRVAVLPPGTLQWASPQGVGQPESNWSYLVMAVNPQEQEIGRSITVGEFDFGL